MNKRVILLLLFLWVPPLSSLALNPDRRTVLSRSGNDRVIALFNLIDSSRTLRSSPDTLSAFLKTVENGNTTPEDPLLKQYLYYFKKISPALFEPDGRKRIQVYDKAGEYFGKKHESRLEAVCLHYAGQENFMLGNYGIAFDKSLRSLNILKKIGYQHVPEIGKYLHDIALNYYYFRDYPKVLELMYESLKHPPYSANLDIQRFNTLALSYRQLGITDSTVSYFRKATTRAEYYRDSTWITLTAGNLGALYASLSEYEKALPLLMLDFCYNKTNTEMPEMARNAALSIANVWLELNEPDSAMHYLGESRRLQSVKVEKDSFGRQQQDEFHLKSYYELLSRYYHQRGNVNIAYLYLDSLHKTSLELDNRYNTMLAKLAEDRLRIQQYISDIELEKEERRTAFVRWLLLLALLLFCLTVLGFLYYLNRAKAAKQKALMQLKETEILSQQKLTVAAFERAKDQLRYQLGLVEEKNLLIEKLKIKLENLYSDQHATSELLEETLAKLTNTRLLTQEDWIGFRRRFNTVFYNSLEELKQKHPDLTQSEERIYALIQLDIGTKQMASMLGISPESVRKTRYRLNKRLKNA